MPSKPMIKSWLPEAIEAFSCVYPAPDVSYVVVTKTEEESVIANLREKMDVPTFHGHGDNWAGLTLPGYKGTVVIIRQNGLSGKKELKYVLWHEMGHAFAFEHESNQNFWATPTPAYMVWAEFIADMIGNKIAMTTGNPIPITAAQHLQDTFNNGKISVASIGHFCSATQHIVIPTGTPEPMVRLSELFREKMKEKEFWKIDSEWLNQIMEQLELLRNPG